MPIDWSTFEAVEEPKSSVNWNDFEPVESDRPPERLEPDLTEPEILRPQIGEGPEDIPPGMSAGTAPRPTEAEWEQARKQSRLGEEIAGTMAEGELVGRSARMFEPNLPRNLLAPTTDEAVREGEAFRASIPPELQLPQPSFRPPLSQETRESLAAGEALSGTLADLSSADQAVILGGAALSGGIPGAAGRIIHGAIPATFGVEGLKSIYEGGKTLLSDDATPEERGQAKVQIGMGATMLPGLGGLVKRPVIAERVIAKTEAAVPGALSKAKAALADTAKRGADIVELPSLAPDAFKTGDAVDFSDAGAQLRGNVVSTGPDFVIIEDVNGGRTRVSGRQTIPVTKGTPNEKTAIVEKPTEAAPVTETAVPREPARAEAGQEREVLLTPVDQYVADVGAGKVTRTEAARDFGRTVKTAEEITQLKEASRQMNEAGDKALAELPTDATLEQQQAAVDLAGRAQFLNEAIESATGAYDVKLTDAKKFRELMEAGQPRNEKAIPVATEAATPAAADQTPIPAGQAPVVESGVGVVPENVSAQVKPAGEMTSQEFIEAASSGATELGAGSKNFWDRVQRRVIEIRKQSPELPYDDVRRQVEIEEASKSIADAKRFAQPLPEPAGQIKAGEGLPKPAASQATTKSAAVSSKLVVEPSATYSARSKAIADKLREQFKTETGGKTFTGPVEIINAAVEVAAKVIEYGGSAVDAMAAAVKHIRTNWKGEFDEAAFRTRFDEAIKVPDTAGENVKMRKSAERATTAPEIPKPVQERIEAAPESRYTQQSMARVEDAVKTMSDADLAAMPAESNLYVASKLEQADRRFRAGDNDGGYAIFVELEKQGTSFGQNINQFKRLAGTRPEYIATAIDKKLTAAGKDPLTPTQRAQAIETTRKAKAADLALDKATDAWTKKPTAENAAKAEAALDKANAEAVELQKFVAKFEPRSTSGVLKSVLQGNLLTPISEVANLFGNMSFLPFRALDRAVGTGLDIIDSAVRGKPRELSVQPLAGTAEALKGVGRGLKQIPSILIEGTGNVIKGETRAGLHPIKAWINQFAKNPEMPTTGGKLTLKDRLNLAIEGTFGVPAEAMLRGLGAGDVPFKEGARARVTAEQLKLNDVPRGNWAFAQKFPELFLPKEALQQIHKDTMAAVFQRESKTLNLLTNWLKGKGEVLDFVAATVAPYKLTPWNIVGEILSYNPLIAMARGVYEGGKGNTRAAKLNAGKMVVGSMLTGTGIWLYKNGLLAPSLDERDEAQKARVLSGKVLPPNHINISGLKRATAGGDPSFKAGDETVDVFRAGGLAGAMFYMTANIGRDMERGPKATDSDMWMNIIRQSTLEQARFGLNQSFLSGVDGLLTAIKEGNADNYLRQWANTVGSIPLPNTLNTVSRSMRQYQVDTKADDFKDKIGNMVKTKLGFAGLDDYLPLKRDFWGKPMLETPEGRDAIFYHFFDISKNKQVTSDPVELELYRLWRKTGDSAVIPSLPQRDITLGKLGYALDPKQYERYAELVGTNRRNIIDAMVINPNFHKLDDERKISVLERAYRDGMERGKGLFYREFNGQLTPKQGRAGFTP